MKTRIISLIMLGMFLFSIPVNAGGKEKIQKYFSNTVNKVKATENAAEKRNILNESFNKMLNALDKVQSSGMITESESNGIELFKANIKEKQDELLGNNNFEKVADSQLNSFSNYVMQDMEQASITISLLALVVIAILIVFLL